MQDYTDKMFGTLYYKRRARFHDLAKFKPHLVKSVVCIGGKETHILKKRNQHAYWMYQCQDCGATGITRGDRMDIFQCKCQKNKKRSRKYKNRSDKKTCPGCKETYPLIQGYWYKRVREGRVYYSTYCKKCRRRRDKEHYDKYHVTLREQSGAVSYTRDDCGRAIR